MSYVPFLSKVHKNNKLIGVEIGVYEGDNASRMCHNLKFERLYVVDPYLKYVEYTSYSGHSQEEWAAIEARAKSKLGVGASGAGSCDGQPVTFLTITSEEASKQIDDNSIDFVYIDANHAYEYVKQDLELWQPKVKPGGYVMGHDWPYPSVQQALNEYLSEHKFTFHEQSGHLHGYHDWWFVK